MVSQFIKRHKIITGIGAVIVFALFVGRARREEAERISKNVEQTINRIEKISPAIGVSSRSFFMGFAAPKKKDWGYDFSEQSVEDTFKLAASSTDLVINHMGEGVPWPEAFEGKPYHPKVEESLQMQLRHIDRARMKVFLYMAPIDEDGLAKYWAEESQMERPGRWKDKRIDDSEAIVAYINFCRDLIRRFQPDFMAYGTEVNFLVKDHDNWKRFLVMAKEVYTRLKAEFPSLPIFASWQIDEHWANPEGQRRALFEILPYMDYIAVSTYPYFYGYFDPNEIPRGYFSDVAALAPDKPFAVAETGFIAENYEALGVKGPGSKEWQDQYARFLLMEGNKLNAVFISWYVPIDYDRSWNKMRILRLVIPAIEAFRVFRDAGLLDEQGRPRESFKTWIEWFKRPLIFRR